MPSGDLVLGFLIQCHLCLIFIKEPSLRSHGGRDSRWWEEEVQYLEGEGQLPGLGLSFLGLAQHSRLKLSGEGSYDPQIPTDHGLDNIVFSERKEVEVGTSRGTPISWNQGSAGLRLRSF